MDLYELFLALHILAAIAWIGSGFMLLVLANRAARQPDGDALGRVIDDTADLDAKRFIPASLLTFAMGWRWSSMVRGRSISSGSCSASRGSRPPSAPAR
jgi:hypothetical protein